MSQPVPKLDLSPKLRRPLSLWNPLDYVRLLYWVFYFPQALRWYINTFAQNETEFSNAKNWDEKFQWFFENLIQTRLLCQGLIAQIFLPYLLCSLLEVLGVEVLWVGVFLGTTFGFFFNIAGLVGGGASSSIAGGIAFGTTLSIVCGIDNAMLFTVIFGIGISVPFSVGGGTAFASVGILAAIMTFGVMVGIVLVVYLGISIGGAFISSIAVLIVCLIASLGGAIGILRIESWVFGLCPRIGEFQKHRWSLPHVTPVPHPTIKKRLSRWLQQDWRAGLEVADQLLKYTLQFIPVIQAVNSALIRVPPASLISHIALLTTLDWEVVRYTSASLRSKLKLEFFEGIILPRLLKKKLLVGVKIDLRLDSPIRATSAGFWYLHECDLQRSITAFQVVKDLPYGSEMLLLATILDRAQVSDLQQIATLNLPPTPHPPLLRPESWNAIAAIRRASEDIRVVCNAASRTARAFASNRALGDLNSILESPDTLPRAERDLILSIALTWRDSLLKSVGEIGRIEVLKPVQNPYVTGDPVEGNLFVGRDDILKQLEELWFMSDRLQSVVLYGHRRMGKTSLLRNVNDRLGSNTQLIYVNLLNLGEVTQGAGEVLLSICDEIAQATNHPAPSDTDLINLPYPTFRRYLQSLIQSPDSKGLIIALDEFEKLEDLITAEKLSPDFLSYLRGLVQMSPKIAFAFAGLHTLEEMTEDYFNPFFASVIPIRLSFLDRASTRQLLANPSDDFPLDYAPDLYDEIFDLTAGQPYLVQLLGFQLVRRYNAQVFEQGRDRSHQFSIDDLTAITESSDLYDNGRYYFTGVWQQAAQSPPRQQEILNAIAHQGLSRDVLLQQFDPAQFDTAIEALRRHDVVHEVNQTWCIKVELFRRWVVKYAIGNY